MDVSREKDAEQLRRIAQAALSENERLTHVLALQGAELDRLRGNKGATQEALTLLEQLREREAKTKASKKKTAPVVNGTPTMKRAMTREVGQKEVVVTLAT